MKKNLQFIRPRNHEEWLELRRGSVGGSEAAAVLNEHEYTDAYTLWCEKTGKTKGFRGNEATRLGVELEDYTARRFCEIMTARRGQPVRVRRCGRTIFNPGFPCAHANIDRRVVGENAVLECKTTGRTMPADQRSTDTIPRMWYWQLQHYIAVGGFDRAYLAVADRTGHDVPFILTVERDDEAIRRLMNAETEFMQLVQSNTAPEPSGLECDRETVRARWPEGNPAAPVIRLSDEWTEELKRREAMKLQIAETERLVRAIDTKLQEAMRDSVKAICSGYRISWKSQRTSAINREALLRDYPDIPLDTYSGTARVLRVTRTGGSENANTQL